MFLSKKSSVNNWQEIVALYFNGTVNESTSVSSYIVLQRLLMMSVAR